MSAGWVAGSVRARALARRRIGASAASDLARCDSLPTALARLGPTPYGRSIRAGQDLGEAQHAVAATLLWHLRVLAGWLPPDGAELIRILAGGFEIANVDELLQRLTARPAGPDFHLGSLATAWSHLAGASSTEDLQARITASPWGDPGGDDHNAIQAGMRLAWAARIAAATPEARPWCAGAAALIVARERFLPPASLTEQALRRARPLIGAGALQSESLPEFARRLPRSARWVVEGVQAPTDLWQAEIIWWTRIEGDGFALLARSGFAPGPIVGALAILAVDAWRVRAALQLAAGGGASMGGILNARA